MITKMKFTTTTVQKTNRPSTKDVMEGLDIYDSIKEVLIPMAKEHAFKQLKRKIGDNGKGNTNDEKLKQFIEDNWEIIEPDFLPNPDMLRDYRR